MTTPKAQHTPGFTPGPWHFSRANDGINAFRIAGNGTILADAWFRHVESYTFAAPKHDEAEANARLIAAAPDLLEACRIGLASMIALQARAECKGEKIISEDCRVHAAFIRAAIAVATGGEGK